MREAWSVDGYVLTDGLVRDVEYRDGTNATPPTRGDFASVAGAHGGLDRGRVKFGPGSFTLNMWLGAPFAGSRADVEVAWDTLLRAIAQPHRLAVYTRTLAGGSQRRAAARMTNVLTPQHIGQRAQRFAAEFGVPAAFWTDLTDLTDQTVAGTALPQDLTLTGKDGATGPMGDLVYTITGPITNPQVMLMSDLTLADYFRYAGTVGGGQTLVVNAATWAVTGTGGLTPDPSLLTFTGDRYLEVTPARPGIIPAVRLIGSGGGGGTRLAVTGKRSFLC